MTNHAANALPRAASPSAWVRVWWDWRVALVGVVFVIAAVGKIANPEPAALVIVHLWHLGTGMALGTDIVRAAVAVLAFIELSLGLVLVLPRVPYSVLVSTALLLLVFSFVLVLLWIKPAPAGCGCLGIAESRLAGVSARVGLLRNAGLIGLLWLGMHNCTASRRLGFSARAMLRRGAPGFALVEMLAVIAIIGVLASLTIVSLGRGARLARERKQLTQTVGLNQALAMYTADYADTHPYFATPNDPLAPPDKKIIGDHRGYYFTGQSYFWTQLIGAYYSNLESVQRPERSRLPRSILVMTNTAFALPKYFTDPTPDDVSMLRSTRTDMVLFPSRKGMLLHTWRLFEGPPGFGPGSPVIVGWCDGSASTLAWPTDEALSLTNVQRPHGAWSKPIMTTRDGLSGTDR